MYWNDSLQSKTTFMDHFSDESRIEENMYRCDACQRVYSHAQSLRNHKKFECGKSAQFGCPHCNYRCKRKGNMKAHILHVHSHCLQKRSA